jgi:hypothetical protein
MDTFTAVVDKQNPFCFLFCSTYHFQLAFYTVIAVVGLYHTTNTVYMKKWND